MCDHSKGHSCRINTKTVVYIIVSATASSSFRFSVREWKSNITTALDATDNRINSESMNKVFKLFVKVRSLRHNLLFN